MSDEAIGIITLIVVAPLFLRGLYLHYKEIIKSKNGRL